MNGLLKVEYHCILQSGRNLLNGQLLPLEHAGWDLAQNVEEVLLVLVDALHRDINRHVVHLHKETEQRIKLLNYCTNKMFIKN